jgi:predicted PurR-regulated permease PerM
VQNTPIPAQHWQQAIMVLSAIGVVTAIVTALFWAQIIFVPITLAIFLAFLLTPPVRFLERRGLHRAVAVILVVGTVFVVVGEFGYLFTRQLGSLAVELPKYTETFEKKFEAGRRLFDAFEPAQKMFDKITGGGQVAPPAEGAGQGAEPKGPDPVLVRSDGFGFMSALPRYLGSALEGVAGMAFSVVLLVYILFRREDLQSRFLRLVSNGRLAFATKVVDEASGRVSRYLSTQAVINICYGIVLATGLALIGVRYALLWGAFAAALRYVPYLGAWAAAFFPVVVSVATFDSWTVPLIVMGFFLALELITFNVIEPMLFKRSMGVSEVAQLVSAAFWGFLWGPIGLVLSAPLTVCCVVLGKYVPQLKFLEILLGDEPALDPAVSFYQRLLAWDQDDATQLIEAEVKCTSAEAVLDRLLIPALNLAKRDRLSGEINQADEEFILRTVREIVDDLTDAAIEKDPTDEDAVAGPRVHVLACPSLDDFDRLALEMLKKVLRDERWNFEVVSSDMLAAEVLERVSESEPGLLCIGSLAPGSLAHVRYLCKRLRSRFPEARFVVGRWGVKLDPAVVTQLKEAGADAVETDILATRNTMRALWPVLAEADRKKLAASSPEKVRILEPVVAAV